MTKVNARKWGEPGERAGWILRHLTRYLSGGGHAGVGAAVTRGGREMPELVAGAVATFALSLIVACGLLRRRCRGVGPPFGPRARPWAVLIVVATAAVSTGVGLLIVAASRQAPAALAGLLVSGGLWQVKLPPQRDRDLLPRTPAAVATLPFRRLYERMGDDMDDWCDARLRAAAPRPQWIADAVTYYYNQVRGGLKDDRALADLDGWRESIRHKIEVVRQIRAGSSPAGIRAMLQKHPATERIRDVADDRLPLLARRLESDALNELHLFLAHVYRLGYHKLLIYPFRPPPR